MLRQVRPVRRRVLEDGQPAGDETVLPQLLAGAHRILCNGPHHRLEVADGRAEGPGDGHERLVVGLAATTTASDAQYFAGSSDDIGVGVYKATARDSCGCRVWRSLTAPCAVAGEKLEDPRYRRCRCKKPPRLMTRRAHQAHVASLIARAYRRPANLIAVRRSRTQKGSAVNMR